MAARHSALTILVTVALALEYEATCRLPEHGIAAGLTTQEVEAFVDAVLSIAEPVQPYFLWRPQLRDPSDEFVLEAAINGRAEMLVTFNMRDFGAVSGRFGIEVLTPIEAFRRMKI